MVIMKQYAPMRGFVILAMVLLAGLRALAQSSPATASPPRAVHELRRDFTLEQTAFARTHRLTPLLQSRVGAKLDLVTRGILAHLASGSEKVDPYTLAQREVRSKFVQLSSEQSNLLNFYVLAEVARILTVPDQLKVKLDSLNELSETTFLHLQMMMDRRSKFISALSNIMKKISTTEDTLVQNLK